MNEQNRTSGAVSVIAALALCTVFILFPQKVLLAGPSPIDIADRITDLTGLLPQEIDQMFVAEQAANVVMIPYEIVIPIVLEARITYLLIRVSTTGQWIRQPILADEWESSFRPYLESVGVVIHDQASGTIDELTAAEEAGQIAADASLSASETADRILYGAVRTTYYAYDAQGRLVKVEHSGTVNDGVKTEYQYDDANNRTRKKATGAGG